jgi:subtilase family serine protease
MTTPASAAPVKSPRTVVNSAPSWTAGASKVAETPAAVGQQMSVVLKLRDAAGAEALAAAVSDPTSDQYGKYVSAAAWRARFAPTDATVAAVTSWLKSQGFTIGAIPANHRYISFAGTSGQAEKAFATDLKIFNKDGQKVTAPASALSVPTALAGSIVGVSGLDASARATPQTVGGAENSKDQPKVASIGTTKPTTVLPPPGDVFRNAAPCSNYYGEKIATTLPAVPGLTNPLPYAPCGYKPAQLRGAYGTTSSLQSGVDGRGATVAIVDAFASPYILKDAQQYAKRNDPSHPFRAYQFSQNLPANYRYIDECGASGWYGEETLDVEAAHAMAPAANILYVGASSCDNGDLIAAVNTVVDNQLAEIISNSYGSTEADALSDPYLDEEHQSYLQAAAQGISVLFSSGDNGDEIANTGVRQADAPADDPYVTAVGGTALAVGKSNNYLFEQGWGTGKSSLKNGVWAPLPPAYLYGGGGGTSQLYKQPSYQKNVVPSSIANYFGSKAGRAVPDVAMVGDPNTGFLVGQSQTFPDGTIHYSEYRIGGTSLSSPLFAGVVAVADQYNGGTLGFLNPKIYKLAGTSAFTDVNHGRAVTDGVIRIDYANGYDGADGLLTSVRTLNQTGTIYTRAGYDDVTGVGSPNGYAFFYGIVTGTPYKTSPKGGSGGGTSHGAPLR